MKGLGRASRNFQLILIKFLDIDNQTLGNGYGIRVQILRRTKRDNNWNADNTDDADLRG